LKQPQEIAGKAMSTSPEIEWLHLLVGMGYVEVTSLTTGLNSAVYVAGCMAETYMGRPFTEEVTPSCPL
jgi:hypothetical protein